ncbi:pirin family protein, partial [Lishizhenia sp.]|uniref:pirin family protein n=1 Tax=Lishizhenia sp. TaxID=2497594 RepID=UPI00299E23A8
TYLLEGSMQHRDSLGSNIEITPGAVNWMSAGKGVVHSERTPQAMRGKEKTMHGLQIWVAQPKEVENNAPFFSHTEAQDLPTWQADKVNYKLVAGKAFGKTSPVPVHSELFLLEITAKEAAEVCIGKELYGEVGIYILEGKISAEGNTYEAKQLLVNTAEELCSIELGAHAHIFIFGGIPFEEERFIFWNFVSSDKDVIEKAKEDWMQKRFAMIEGEDDLVPIPGMEFEE